MKDFASLKCVRGLLVLGMCLLPLSVRAEDGKFHWLNVVGDFVKDGLGPVRTAEDLAREEDQLHRETSALRSKDKAAVTTRMPEAISPSPSAESVLGADDTPASKDMTARTVRPEERSNVRGKSEASSPVSAHAPTKDAVSPSPKPVFAVKPAAVRERVGASAASAQPSASDLGPPETTSEMSPLDDLPDDDGGAMKKEAGKLAAPTVRRPDARPAVAQAAAVTTSLPAQPLLPSARRIAATATVDQALQAGGPAELYSFSPSK